MARLSAFVDRGRAFAPLPARAAEWQCRTDVSMITWGDRARHSRTISSALRAIEDSAERRRCRAISQHLLDHFILICPLLFTREPFPQGRENGLTSSVSPVRRERARANRSASGSLMLSIYLCPLFFYIGEIAVPPLHSAHVDSTSSPRFYLCSVTARAARESIAPPPGRIRWLVRRTRLDAAAAPDRAPGQGGGGTLGAPHRADGGGQDPRRLPPGAGRSRATRAVASPANPFSARTRFTSRR